MQMKSLEASYEILGLQPGAGFEDVKKAFRKKALLYHPDVAGEGCSLQFQQINEAYAVLKRALIDKFVVNAHSFDSARAAAQARELFIKRQIENILLEAQKELSELVKTVDSDVEIKLSDVLLRLQSRHPAVRFVAACHLGKMKWDPSYMDELMKDISKIALDDVVLELLLGFLEKAPVYFQRKILANIAMGAKGLQEEACIKLLYWGKRLGWDAKTLSPLLTHDSRRVAAIAVSMLPTADDVPLMVLMSLIERDDEEILVPLLKKMRGYRNLCYLRGRIRELADNHPSLGVRAWAKWLVGDANVG